MKTVFGFEVGVRVLVTVQRFCVMYLFLLDSCLALGIENRRCDCDRFSVEPSRSFGLAVAPPALSGGCFSVSRVRNLATNRKKICTPGSRMVSEL
jgi:hypothetical protein